MSGQKQNFLRRWLIGELSWWRIGRSLVGIYAIVCVYIFVAADGMIFLPPASSYRDTEAILKLTTANGHQISATYLEQPAADYTLIYSHGNAEDLGQILPVLRLLYEAGFSVLAYDYSGYGTSQGNPSERQSYQDIDAAYHYLTDELGRSPAQIIIHGRSVGGGPSVDLASRESIGGLIVESTFTSAFRVVLPIPLFPFDKFRNLAKLPEVTAPVLVIHGEGDRQISLWHGQQLYAAASDPKRSLWVSEAGHNDLVMTAGRAYPEAIQEFATLLTAP